MKAVKVILVVVAVLIGLVILTVCAGIFFTNRYLQTAAFKESVLKSAHDELGADVRIDELHASLFSGVELRGVTIGNPPGFTGNMVTAEAFVLRYRLWPLLSRRVEIEQLSLDKPVITLARGDKGDWNYEKFGAKEAKETEAKPGSAAAQPAAPAKPAGATSLDVVLSKLAIANGTVSMVSEKNEPLVTLGGINFSSSVSLIDNKLAGNGKAGIDKINLSNQLMVEKVGTPVMFDSDQVKLSALSGTLAKGALTGDVALKISEGFQYTVNLQVKDCDIATFFQDAGKKQVLSGTLKANVALTGTGGLPTIIGNGRAEIDNGQLMEIPLVNLLATILQIDALRELKFSECLVEFSISNNVMQTPVIRLTSPGIQITGKGSVALDTHALNHNMTLTFPKGALDRSPVEILNLFVAQPDGSLALNFKVTGTYDHPKTDLGKSVLKGIGQQLLEQGQKFLK
ncbi:MAG TPA: AsmA-like C-terminal domain-containing protein [Verrucomicrobiae bacterium]|nr:AsmA-like C-terminal domain-containing protein [Verrucomicrobiae bacterium]